MPAVVGHRDLITPSPKLRLLDQVREVMRLKHYATRTETAYCDWIRRCIPLVCVPCARSLGNTGIDFRRGNCFPRQA
jgi:hypothetical protein